MASSHKFFGFVDDLWTFNNDKVENNYNDVYPDEFELNTTTQKKKILVKPRFWNFK